MRLGSIKALIDYVDWDSLPSHIRQELIDADYNNTVVSVEEASKYLEMVRNDYFLQR